MRDLLLGIAPKDWDIATSALPDEIERLFPCTVSVGKAFGVIIVHTAAGDYELATFRGEGAYLDGRRPESVHFTGAEEDVKRRDFTINALLYDPFERQVIDFVGGVRDLRERRIRTVGDPGQRFSEDHLRLLRAVRFAARTGFSLTDETQRAMQEQAALAANVSGERLGEELTQMFSSGHACRALELLRSTGILPHVIPEVSAMQGVPQPPEYHPEGDVWNHTLIMMKELDARLVALLGTPPAPGAGSRSDPTQTLLLGDSPEILAWAALLHDTGKPGTLVRADRLRFNGHDKLGARLADAVLRRLRRPNAANRKVSALIEQHMTFSHLLTMREAKRRRALQDPLFPLRLELHRLDCLASHGKLDHYAWAVEAWCQEMARPPIREPLITGRDLIRAGYAPGPQMGTILDAVADARLEGEIDSRETAMAWVCRTYPLN